MTKVTNRSPGPRFFWEKGPGHTAEKPVASQKATVLYPGDTAELDLLSTDDPITKAWLDAGEIEFGAQGERPSEPQKPQKPAPAKLETLTDDELRTYITERGGKVDGRWSKDRLLDEARSVAAQG